MDNESGQDKTEEPTGKRVEDAHKKGDFPRSQELASIAVLVTSLYVLYFSMEDFIQGFSSLMRDIFTEVDRPINTHTIGLLSGEILNALGISILRFFLILAMAAMAVAISQVGWSPSDEALVPNLERLNPLPKIKQLFSPAALFDLAKSSIKLVVVSIVAYRLVSKNSETVLQLPEMGMRQGLLFLGDLMYRFALQSLLWLSVLAIVDYIYQRYTHHQRMMMSKEEVKEEGKSREGNPMVKSKLRRIARQRIYMKTGLGQVKTADVVVTNPTHFAIALRYVSGEMRAPVVVSRGADLIAEKIKAEARRYGIPRVENRMLARSLYSMTRVGDEIPGDMYKAVAEVLAYVYRVKQQNQFPPGGPR